MDILALDLFFIQHIQTVNDLLICYFGKSAHEGRTKEPECCLQKVSRERESLKIETGKA